MGKFFKDIIFVFSFFRRYLKFLILAIPFSLVFSSSRGLLALFTKEGVDRGLVQGSVRDITNVVLYIVILFIVSSLSRVLSSYFINYSVQGVIRDIREKVFSNIVSVSLDRNISSSTTVSRLLGDVEVISSFPDLLKTILKEPFSLLFLSCVLMYINWKLALFSLGAFSFVAIPALYIGKKVRKASLRTRESADSISQKLIESIQGAKVIRIYSLDIILSVFRKQLDIFRRYSIKSRVLPELNSSIADLSGALIIGAVVIFSAIEISSGNMTVGSFFAFVGATVGLWEPIKNLIRIPSEIGRIIPSAERINEFQIIPTMSGGHIKKENFEESILFDGVCVRFGDKLILNNVNLEIKKGQKVSIIGRSGVGKTTLVSLLPRFFDPSEGSVKIDGFDLRHIDIQSLRRLIGFVEQEPFIFDDTIYENVRIAKPDSKRSEIEIAIQNAGFELDKIDLNRRCGENGRNLSQGQRQRIAIARAFLKNSPIIIMDEPTASVDPELEESLLKTFERLMEGKTVFIVSHKPKTALFAQTFIMIEGGRVYEVDRDMMMNFFFSSV